MACLPYLWSFESVYLSGSLHIANTKAQVAKPK